MSPEGRRRLVLATLRVGTVTVVIGGVLWGAWQVSRMIGEKTPRTSAPAPAELVKDIQLVTDGALDRAWIVGTLALPKDATLLELDLEQLRARVLGHGQVITAMVERQFPSTLVVRVSERSPVARVRIAVGDAAPQSLLVARDGVVFSGFGFDPAMLETLPWLDGVKLARSGGGFAPINGMATVAELLAKAKLDAEHLYQTWQVVSLARLESDGVIEVRTRGNAHAALFSTTEDYLRQLARLDWTLDEVLRKTGRAVARIDLTTSTQARVVLAAVAVGEAPRASAGNAPAPAAARPLAISAFQNLSSQNKNKL